MLENADRVMKKNQDDARAPLLQLESFDQMCLLTRESKIIQFLDLNT